MRQLDGPDLLLCQPVDLPVLLLLAFALLLGEHRVLINNQLVLANYVGPVLLLIVLEYLLYVHVEAHELGQTLLTKQPLSLQVHLSDALVREQGALLDVFPLANAILLQKCYQNLHF